jgi:signal transduction histidine kinase
VLQVLALVQRRGAELGGPAAELGRLAGEQETALRALVSLGPLQPAREGTTDLCAALRELEAPRVTLALPAARIPMASARCAEVAAAVRAALDNVHRHTPSVTRAWISVEESGACVVVTVRDDGPGFAPERLAQAETEGRLGIAQSIRKRIEHLGGTVVIIAAPGQGAEIELRVPTERESDG